MRKITKHSERMTRKQEKKRKAIIESAIETFSKRGFHRAKISEIAKHAKVADGTVYLYFKNKDELLMKAFEYLFEEKLKDITEKVNQEDSPAARLDKFFDLHIELFTANPHIARFMSVELRQSPEFYGRYPKYWPLQGYLNFLHQLCSDAVEAKVIRPIDTHALTYIIFGTVDFILTLWTVHRDNVSLEALKKQIIDIIRYGTRDKV